IIRAIHQGVPSAQRDRMLVGLRVIVSLLMAVVPFLSRDWEPTWPAGVIAFLAIVQVWSDHLSTEGAEDWEAELVKERQQRAGEKLQRELERAQLRAVRLGLETGNCSESARQEHSTRLLGLREADEGDTDTESNLTGSLEHGILSEGFVESPALEFDDMSDNGPTHVVDTDQVAKVLDDVLRSRPQMLQSSTRDTFEQTDDRDMNFVRSTDELLLKGFVGESTISPAQRSPPIGIFPPVGLLRSQDDARVVASIYSRRGQQSRSQSRSRRHSHTRTRSLTPSTTTIRSRPVRDNSPVRDRDINRNDWDIEEVSVRSVKGDSDASSKTSGSADGVMLTVSKYE
ncbi:hypothetical protein HDU93_003180, partial [Gonapodya sp. JEL0774]